jgi:hypothetical protein
VGSPDKASSCSVECIEAVAAEIARLGPVSDILDNAVARMRELDDMGEAYVLKEAILVLLADMAREKRGA